MLSENCCLGHGYDACDCECCGGDCPSCHAPPPRPHEPAPPDAALTDKLVSKALKEAEPYQGTYIMRRIGVLARHLHPEPSLTQQLLECRSMLTNLLQESPTEAPRVATAGAASTRECIRLAILDSCIGGSGTITLTEGQDARVDSAIQLLRPIKEHLPLVSWADLIQMSRAVAVQVAQGFQIQMRYGRVDADPENVEMASQELWAMLNMLDCSSMEQLRVDGLPAELQLALAGDLVNNCEDAGKMNLVELPTEEVEDLHYMYQLDRAAFLRDYSRAHVAHSEIGATFSPANGVKLENA